MDRIHQYNDDDSIDTLYKAMELAEPLPKPNSPRVGRDEVSSSPPLPQSISLNHNNNDNNNSQNGIPSSSYVAIDATAQFESPEQRQHRQQSQQPQPPPQYPQQDDDAVAEERAFIWELLEFARKRNWKKKLLTYVHHHNKQFLQIKHARMLCERGNQPFLGF